MTELRATIADLGKGSGSISPSVYDTAQVLRLYAPQESGPALTWLLSQQQADGGWGAPETPYARDVPTLAAVLALHSYHHVPHTHIAREAGLAFLRRQADQWAEIPIDALPTATEIILPYLIEEAQICGLAIDPTLYTALYQLRNYKLKQLGKRPLVAGSAPTHSWEALRQEADAILPDSLGSIGLSPSATAAWLRVASTRPDLAEHCKRAEKYLTYAAASTGLDLPGVVPPAWPITGLEIAYALYALLITGLLTEPRLQDVVDPIVDELWIMMKRGHGVSFGENFTPDLDDTAVATAVLQAKARQIDPAVILQFKNGGHFCTYHHELNPSVLANAHALYALTYTNERYPAAEKFLLERQCVDGRWLPDKWHSSWIYTTLEVILALGELGYPAQIAKAQETIIQQQKVDGGWGSGHCANRAETSYALITLSTLRQYGHLTSKGEFALERGYQWLTQANNTHPATETKLWLAKEIYAPYRVDRIYELSTLISVVTERVAA
ncbi:MAG: hypothetical protein NT075_32280 [Chloroflexi bacterium]|nr:hypothetical protein [Chloroflexota bacterium]